MGNFPGGYFLVGWSHDFFRMPELVRDANDDPKFIEKFKANIRKHQRPPFSTNKFLAQIMISYLWCQVFLMAIPDDEFHGYNFNFLHWLIPLVVAVGKESYIISQLTRFTDFNAILYRRLECRKCGSRTRNDLEMFVYSVRCVSIKICDL